MTRRRRSRATEAVWALAVASIAFSALALPGTASPEEPTCRITLFPHQVRTPEGVVQMTAEQLSDATFEYVDNPIASRTSYQYTIGVRLLKPINPRLCRWRGVENEDEGLWFNDDAFDRKALTVNNGFPAVRCMIDSRRDGTPVNFYPPFTRAGTLAPPTALAGTKPLCGDLMGFRAGTMLKLTGEIEVGVTKVLECQSGKESDADQYVNVPLFQAQCNHPPTRMRYENARNMVSDRIFSSLARKQQLSELEAERQASQREQQAALTSGHQT